MSQDALVPPARISNEDIMLTYVSASDSFAISDPQQLLILIQSEASAFFLSASYKQG